MRLFCSHALDCRHRPRLERLHRRTCLEASGLGAAAAAEGKASAEYCAAAVVVAEGAVVACIDINTLNVNGMPWHHVCSRS